MIHAVSHRWPSPTRQSTAVMEQHGQAHLDGLVTTVTDDSEVSIPDVELEDPFDVVSDVDDGCMQEPGTKKAKLDISVPLF